jgi:hypothetical protein
MPWLEKDNADKHDNLLFIHVPRCGGTSLMKSHNVPTKATLHASYYHKIGMTIFFHRYKLLESANFPLYTSGNFVCLGMAVLNIYLRFIYLPALTIDATTEENNNLKMYKVIASFCIAFFITLFIGLTYVFVAPTIGRIIIIRRCFLLLVHYPLCGLMENLEYLTGANIHGYLPHLTAHKMLHYGYVTPKQMEDVSSLAIVRNPYSRMVSIYMYNRFGSSETFRDFIISWYTNMKYYRDSGEMEEWYTPCHVIPQFEYTHFEGSQLVQSIVKQEELKYLKNRHNNNDDDSKYESEDNSVRDLPQTVRDALLGMPHDNKRKTSKPWYEYYDQHTLNLTYEMYQIDFEIFQYSSSIDKRPDLHPPQVSETLAQSVSRSMATPPTRSPPRLSGLSSSSAGTRTATPKSRSSSIELSTTTRITPTQMNTKPITHDQQQQQQQHQQQNDDDPLLFMPPHSTTTPPPQHPFGILFESFSRDTSSETKSNVDAALRRSSLLTKSARVSARRSSMVDSIRSSTTRSIAFSSPIDRGVLAHELSKLVDDDEEDNDENNNNNEDGIGDGGQKKND